MATVGNLRDRILRLLDDPNALGYTDNAIRDALISAQDALLPWVPKLQVTAITGTGASSYILPADLYEVQAVVIDESGLSIGKSTLSPSSYHGSTISAENDWILYPSGYISFSKTLDSGIGYTLYYTSRYTEPEDPLNYTEVPEPPSWTSSALCYFAASVLLVPDAVSASTIRQFNTRVDSGTPEHNPMQKSVTFLQQLFLQEMNRNPKFVKVSP